MIERQRAIELVFGVGVGRAGEGAHVELRARVRDLRGLRHAGGAGGVDVERGVARLDARRAARAAGALARASVLSDRARAGLRPARLRRRSPRASAAAPARRGWCRTRRRLSVSVMTWLAPEMERQCASAAPVRLLLISAAAAPTFGQAHPGRNVFGAVRQQQRDGVAALQALRIGPGGEAVGERVELAVGEALAFEHERGVVGEFVDGGFEIVADQHVRIPDRSRARATTCARGRSRT